MPDAIFENPRLARVYDPLDPDRDDLDVYAAIAGEFEARSLLDIGCGTGTFACLMAARGLTVTGLDPAAASLEVARSKPGADRVHWIHGFAPDLPPMRVDLATMTGNVAQVFLTDEDWAVCLRAVRRALRPGGRLVFETRDPAAKAWLEWTKEKSFTRAEIPGTGAVRSWVEVTDVDGDFVTFQGILVFEAEGDTLVSDSTLRFRSRRELIASLDDAGFELDEIRGAPDRPGREMVFVAVNPDGGDPSDARA